VRNKATAQGRLGQPDLPLKIINTKFLQKFFSLILRKFGIHIYFMKIVGGLNPMDVKGNVLIGNIGNIFKIEFKFFHLILLPDNILRNAIF